MTPFTLSNLGDLRALDVDTIIDVRSPAEFAEDHVPGAINLPVLDNDQRAEVGTIYTRQSPFLARKIGAALVAQNTATHLQTALRDKDGGWRPMVYCWRGGQRSGAFATILDQIGWRVQLLKGGYQSYRRAVVKTLYDTPLPHRFTLLDGGTGTAKTELLYHLQDAGAQIIDLEGMAEHRGSLFGGLGSAQPAQKMFETRLAAALSNLDPAQMTFVEAESSKIGERIIPPALWAAMGDAERVHLTAPQEARSAYLCRAYADLIENAAQSSELIDKLRPFHAAETISTWQALAAEGAWEPLARALIAEHYDPRYAKSAARRPKAQYEMALDALDGEALKTTAQKLVTQIR